MKKHTLFYLILFIIICAIGVILRFLVLDVPLYDDAAGIPFLGKYYDPYNLNMALTPHTPLTYIFFQPGMELFGVSTIGLRFTLLLLSIIYLIVLYFFVKKILSIKTACYAVFLNLFTFFAFFNYFFADTDATINALFSLIIFFSLYLSLDLKGQLRKLSKNKVQTGNKQARKDAIRNKSIFWFVVSLFTFVFLVSIKYRTGLLIIPIFFYIWYSTRKLKKTIFYCAIYVFCALLAFAISFVLIHLMYGEMAPYLLNLMFARSNVRPEIIYKLMHPHLFIPLLVSLSPLLLLLPILTLKKLKKEYFLFYSWLLIIPVYLVLIPPGLPIIKYVSGFLLPPITILSAEAISREKIKKSMTIWILICVAIISGIFTYVNNIIPTDYWFFMSEMGPVVKVWQPFIYFIFPFTFLLFVYIWFKKQSPFRVYALSLFIILTLSFSIMMITDNIVDKTHNIMIKEVQEYAAEHEGELGIVYSWNEDIAFYLGNRGHYLMSEDEVDAGFSEGFDDGPAGGIDDNKYLREYGRSTGLGQQGYIDLNYPIEQIEQYISQKGGTVFLLNYPYKYVVASLDVQKKIALFDSYCIKEHESIYKTGTLVIYSCEGTI